MSGHLEYKGYVGSAEVSFEDQLLVGKLLFIQDTITYVASTPAELETAFKEAVDDYLDTCKELGDAPDVPCKGSFNVRVGPELHKEMAIAARRKGAGLNDLVREAIIAYLGSQQVRHVHHHHDLTVTMKGESTTRIVTSGQSVEWESPHVATAH